MNRIILASASPRRRELMTQIGLKYDVIPSNKEENADAVEPCRMVMALSECKAKDVFSGLNETEQKNALVIGADTMVALGNQVMGKPKDAQNAEEMLILLQGNTHQVYTGVTLVWRDDTGTEKQHTFFEKTDVTMFPMTKQEIEAYVAGGEPMDKAGAYGIQGKCAAFIKEIHGDYNNVVGLPIGRLYQEMKTLIRFE